MSALTRLLRRLPSTRRAYSSFGGGRYFNSSRLPKSPVVTAKSKSDAADNTPKDSSTKVSAAKTAQNSDTSSTANPSKSNSDPLPSEPGHEHTPQQSSSPPKNLSTVSGHGSGYSTPDPYGTYLSPHPTVSPKDFKLHQFFSLHRPLLLMSNTSSIFASAPVNAPLFRSLTSIQEEAEGIRDKLPPSPFTSLNLDGTYVGAVSGVDGDAEAARQLHHSLTINRVGAVADWEETLRKFGLDVSQDAERVQLQAQWEMEWREVMLDSVKRKRRKKMKKHKLKKRRRATRAQRLKIGR